MIAVFPERTAARLTLVVFPCRTYSNQLHALGYDVSASVFHQEVNVVARHHIVEHRKTKRFFGVKNPVRIRRRSRIRNSRNAKSGSLEPGTLNLELPLGLERLELSFVS
jgi:hypothetical protein